MNNEMFYMMSYRSIFLSFFIERVAISISTGENTGGAFYTCCSCGHIYENLHQLKTHRSIRKIPGDNSEKKHFHILSVPPNDQISLNEIHYKSPQIVDFPPYPERKLELPGTRAVSEPNSRHQCKGEVIKSGTRLEKNNRTGTSSTKTLRKYLCTCGKSFGYPLALQRHIKMYAEARFKCGTCGERFILESQLVAHAVALKHERPFRCSKCEMGFYNCPALAFLCSWNPQL